MHSALTGAALFFLRTRSKLPKLRSLEVCGGDVSDAGVAHLAGLAPTLEHLCLAHNPRIGNPSIASLIKCEQLTSLNLSQVV